MGNDRNKRSVQESNKEIDDEDDRRRSLDFTRRLRQRPGQDSLEEETGG